MARTPSLDALRIFVVGARHLSFTDAANTLNLTQSAVNHRILGLEKQLGLALFKRLTRRLELTPRNARLRTGSTTQSARSTEASLNLPGLKMWDR
jgi:LysR family transcriptional regulator, glycine cleavage system transcriptional activator